MKVEKGCLPSYARSLRHSFLTFLEDSVVIHVPIFNNFYYNLLIEGFYTHKQWPMNLLEMMKLFKKQHLIGHTNQMRQLLTSTYLD